MSDSAQEGLQKSSSEFIGLVILTSASADDLVLPEDLTLPAAAATTTLIVELGYFFLPTGWGKGYATESIKVVLETCKKARSFGPLLQKFIF